MSSQVLEFNTSNFTWIDVAQPTKKELKELASKYSLHSTSVQDCLDPEHLPKYEKIGAVVFLISRVYDPDCHIDADNVQELTRKIAIFVGENFLITVHRRDLPFIKTLRDTYQTPLTEAAVPPPVPTLIQLLSEILKGTLQTYKAPIDAAYEKLEALEIETFHVEQPVDVIEQGYYLKRRASVIERILRLSLDSVQRLAATHGQGQPYLQDVKEQAESLLFYSDELVTYVTNLLNLHLSLQSHRTNEVVRLLTVFSVFFLPLNFFASIYGMNFEHMPGLGHPAGFAISLISMALFATAIFLYFRRKGWMRRPQKIFKGHVHKKASVPR